MNTDAHRRRLGRHAVPLLLALLAALPLHAQRPGPPAELSLEEAIRQARDNNPGLLSQRNDLRVGAASARSAMGELLPGLNATLGFGYTAPGERRAGSVVLAEQPSIYSSSYALNASYSLSVPRLFGPAVARDEARATRARVDGAEATLVSDVTQRYLAAAQATARLRLAEREVARAAEHVRSTRDRLEVGAVTPVELKRAEVQQGRAEIRRMRAGSTLAVELQGLARLMGVRLAGAPRLSTPFALTEPRWERDDLVARTRRNNPVLRAAAASVGAAGTRVRVARAAALPTVSLGLSLNGWSQVAGDEEMLVQQRLGPGVHDAATVERVRRDVQAQNRGFPFGYNRQPLSASMSVSLPVFSGFGRALSTEQARAAAEDARLQLRTEEQRVEEEVATALLDLRSAYAAATMGERVLDAAAEELAMAEERFRLGMANALAVLDAQAQLAEAEGEQSDAVFEFHRALARLEALVGEPLR